VKYRVPGKRTLDGGEHQIELDYSFIGFLFLSPLYVKNPYPPFLFSKEVRIFKENKLSGFH